MIAFLLVGFIIFGRKGQLYTHPLPTALLKSTSQFFLVSSITCRSKEAIEWVWSFFVVK
jgi:hypothetical protein